MIGPFMRSGVAWQSPLFSPYLHKISYLGNYLYLSLSVVFFLFLLSFLSQVNIYSHLSKYLQGISTMAILEIDLDAEQAAFDKEVAEVEAWWKTPRHAALRR
jgi:hypothetical protein